MLETLPRNHKMTYKEKLRFLVSHCRESGCEKCNNNTVCNNVKRQLPITEEMKLSREIQDVYDRTPKGDETDQLEFDFGNHHRDFADECDCRNCKMN